MKYHVVSPASLAPVPHFVMDELGNPVGWFILLRHAELFIAALNAADAEASRRRSREEEEDDYA
jgi:hypothetical protein